MSQETSGTPEAHAYDIYGAAQLQIHLQGKWRCMISNSRLWRKSRETSGTPEVHGHNIYGAAAL